MLGRIPWLALSLLLATNTTLGGFLSAWHEHWSVWLGVSLGIVLLGGMLSCSWSTMRDSFAYLLSSDLKAFIAAVLIALLGVAIVFWLLFMLPTIFISLGSELLGTSTGFPFGDYSYLSGLGYKIGGLVPFTIPLSWFYVGLAAYLLARVGLNVDRKPTLLRHLGAIALGAAIFTSWDFALEPAMSQTAVPFWFWEEPGAFFGTPYRNYAGWFGTSALFMSVAALLWRTIKIPKLQKPQLILPLIVYLTNFIFAAVMSCAAGYWIPVLLGFAVGVVPAIALWNMAQVEATTEDTSNDLAVMPVKQVAYK